MHLDPSRPTLTGDDGYWDDDYNHEYLSGDGELAYMWWPKGYMHGELNVPNYGRGFGFKWNEYMRAVIVPHWFVALLTSVLPLAWTVHAAFRIRHSKSKRCWKCGYDLRVTPDHCPECGTESPKSSR